MNDGLDDLGTALISLTGYADRLRMHCLLAYVNVKPTKTGASFTSEGAWEYDQMTSAGNAAAGPLAGPLLNMPPLLTLESLLFQIIALGFALLTLTLVTGALFSETLFGKAIRFDHKTLFAIISWIIFAVLLAGRFFYGWRGRMALRYTLAGFVSLLLAYVGTRFVLEVILQRPMA